MKTKSTANDARTTFRLSNIASGTYGWMKRNKRCILVATAWGIGISLIIIRAYWSFYLENVKFFMYKLAYRSWEGPLLSELDWLLLGILSLVAVMGLDDFTAIFWSYVASIPLSLTLAVAFASYFIWSVLEFREFLIVNPHDWEWVVVLATFNISRMVPHVMFFCFLGLVFGLFLKSWWGDSAF